MIDRLAELENEVRILEEGLASTKGTISGNNCIAIFRTEICPPYLQAISYDPNTGRVITIEDSKIEGYSMLIAREIRRTTMNGLNERPEIISTAQFFEEKLARIKADRDEYKQELKKSNII